MPVWAWFLIICGFLFVFWAALIAALFVTGRHTEARGLAGFIPDCLMLVRGLLGDSRVPRRQKVLLVALLGYLALPFDLVPDFIPVAGQLDDVLIVGWVLRRVVRGVDTGVLREHWRGPEQSLRLILRFAGIASAD